MGNNYEEFRFKEQIKEAIKEEYGTNASFEKELGIAKKTMHVQVRTRFNQFKAVNEFLNKLKLKLVITKMDKND